MKHNLKLLLIAEQQLYDVLSPTFMANVVFSVCDPAQTHKAEVRRTPSL